MYFYMNWFHMNYSKFKHNCEPTSLLSFNLSFFLRKLNTWTNMPGATWAQKVCKTPTSVFWWSNPICCVYYIHNKLLHSIPRFLFSSQFHYMNWSSRSQAQGPLTSNWTNAEQLDSLMKYIKMQLKVCKVAGKRPFAKSISSNPVFWWALHWEECILAIWKNIILSSLDLIHTLNSLHALWFYSCGFWS